MRPFRRRLHGEVGATAAEYVLMVSLIAVVIIAAVAAFGLGVNALFDEASTKI